MSDGFERLYWYYNDRVSVFSDPDFGIITVQAQAFSAADAQAIARQLLAQAEGLVNAMNARLEADTVRSAETAVAEASKVVLAAQEDVTRFRNAQVVVDPSQNAVAQLARSPICRARSIKCSRKSRKTIIVSIQPDDRSSKG